MIKAVEFPNKTFATKEDLFAELKRNEAKLIELKKSCIHKSHEKNQVSFLNLEKFSAENKKGFDVNPDCIYPVVSTTNYMDSHEDVHFNGCFSKTEKEQQGKVVYTLDHELKWDSILAWQKDVRMFTALIDWAMVGKSYPGQTEALVFEIPKAKIIRKDVLQAIEDKCADFENSIRMIYFKITLAINSTSDEYKSNKAYYDSKIDLIANKEDAEESGYFWGVDELGIYKEASLVVAGGSNDATAIITEEKENTEPSDDTLKNEPPTDGTQDPEPQVQKRRII